MSRSPHSSSFHDDMALHDHTVESVKWTRNPIGNVRALVTLAKGFLKKDSTGAARKAVTELNVNDDLSEELTKKMVSKLWGSLLHPPHSYQGNQFKYRTPDGSFNNIIYPDLGRSRLPYAKTVQGRRAHHGARPDPGDLFDLLMARRDSEKGRESTSGISSLLLCHATIIIHDIFRTDDDDPTKSTTSAYLDLAPLYGSTKEEQMSVRTKTNGWLKPDTFFEDRIVNQAPGLLIINENGRFSLPHEFKTYPPEDPQMRQTWQDSIDQQDEDLFQTARLITCGLYIQISIHDYLRVLMLVHEKNTAWTLDPRLPYPEGDDKMGLKRGEGNMVSVEFNLLYRFHSPISRRDAAWTEELFVRLMKAFGVVKGSKAVYGPTPSDQYTEEEVRSGEVHLPQFLSVYEKLKQRRLTTDAKTTAPFYPSGFDSVYERSQNTDDTRQFAFEREGGRYFDDQQLVAELLRTIEDPICNFGPQNVPKALKQIEILGILQGRKWEVATLNEFREFFGISRHKHFEDINSNVDIQTKLRDLYEDPDLVELYPGLFCEGMDKVLDPGSSCPNNESTALWRGVFSDAVSLVRSDRFYTTDWNVDSMTAWGFNEISSNPDVNKGSVLHVLFERAFPGYFAYNSLHMWQPFYTPTRNLALAKQQGYLDFLDLSNLEVADPVDWWDWQHDQSKVSQSLATNRIHDRYLVEAPAGKRIQMRMEGSFSKWYRGTERALKPPEPYGIVDHEVIQSILNGPFAGDFCELVMPETYDIPNDTLREVSDGRWSEWKNVYTICIRTLGGESDWEQDYMNYFVDIAQEIRLRQERYMQRYINRADAKDGQGVQTKQIDIVKDYAIPIVTHFMADSLHFYTELRRKNPDDAPYSEHDIYQHIANCQNYQAFDSDLAKAWEKRMAYKKSMSFLWELAKKGIDRSHKASSVLTAAFRVATTPTWSIRTKPATSTEKFRSLSSNLINALAQVYGNEAVTAIMLMMTLNTVQRIVATFTETLAVFIDPDYCRQDINVGRDQELDVEQRTRQIQIWDDLTKIAWDGTNKVANPLDGSESVVCEDTRSSDQLLQRYVLEAFRLSLNQPQTTLVYDPTINSAEVPAPGGAQLPLQAGEHVVLGIHDALLSEGVFPQSSQFDVTRDPALYLSLGDHTSLTSQRPINLRQQITLIALTGMVKHCAHMNKLRVAHDVVGHLRRVYNPASARYQYMSPEWNAIVPYPATWNLRFDGIGRDVSTILDNADQGHGGNQVTYLTASLRAELNSSNKERMSTQPYRSVGNNSSISNETVANSVRVNGTTVGNSSTSVAESQSQVEQSINIVDSKPSDAGYTQTDWNSSLQTISELIDGMKIPRSLSAKNHDQRIDTDFDAALPKGFVEVRLKDGSDIINIVKVPHGQWRLDT